MKKQLSALMMIITLVVFSLTNSVSGNNISNTISPLQSDAAVSFDFDGLMAICLGDPKRASIGLLDVEHHTPEISITKTRANRTTTLATFRGNELHDSFYIDLAGVQPGEIIRYQAAAMERDSRDFRWTIDMESDLFQKQLYVREDRLVGKIHISNAIFYSELLSDQKVKFFSADGKQANFNRQIAAPTAQIALKNGDVLVIKNSKKTVRLVGEPGVNYRINIHNLPTPDMASMDHFLYYYDYIGEKVTNYEMVAVNKTAYAPKPMMCYSLIFGKSSLND